MLTMEQQGDLVRQLSEWADTPRRDCLRALQHCLWDLERAKAYLREPQPRPAEMQSELLELMVKAGRRCAHDLAHAASLIGMQEPPRELVDELNRRAEEWRAVFYPDGGPKNYRARLHDKIEQLQDRVDELEKLCVEHGIDTGKDVF